MNKIIKILSLTVIALALAIVAYLVFVVFFLGYKTKNEKSVYLHIYPNSTKEDIKQELFSKTEVQTTLGFDIAEKLLKYNKMRTGRYEVKSGMNSLSIVRMLRNGAQKPLKLRIRPIRTTEQLARQLSSQLMEDSTAFINVLTDTALLANYNLTPKTVIVLFIPNSYEVFWNTTPKNLLKRMHKEYTNFWNNSRRKKAELIPLSIMEVNILSTIVDSETNSVREKPVVAGLYINRLKKGIPLQADPTVVFAVGDFTIRRVLLEHIKIDSPYNTYLNKGLPPGPIRTPTKSGIDAVLNYDKNDYIFMCASEKFNGEHNFAKTLSEHLSNARKYQRELNRRGIKK